MTLCGSKSAPRPNIVSRLLSRFGFQEFSGGDLGARLPRRISEIVTEHRGRGFHYLENIIMIKVTSEINALATRHIKDVCLFSAHIPLWYINALKPVYTNTVKISGITGLQSRTTHPLRLKQIVPERPLLFYHIA